VHINSFNDLSMSCRDSVIPEIMKLNWVQQASISTRVGTGRHCRDQYLLLFQNWRNTAMLVQLHDRLCNAFLVCSPSLIIVNTAVQCITIMELRQKIQ